MNGRLIGFVAVIAYAHGGCPDDPGFLLSDTRAPESDVVVDGDVVIDEVRDSATEEQSDEVACVRSCGPVTTCDQGTCVCESAACDGKVADDSAWRVAIDVSATAEPSIAYLRTSPLDDVRLTRFRGEWEAGRSLAEEVRDPVVSLVHDIDGRRVVLVRAADGTAKVLWERGDEHFDVLETANPCWQGELAHPADAGIVLLGCVDPTEGMLQVFASDGEAPFATYSQAPLDIGDPVSEGGGRGFARMAATDEDVFVAFTHELEGFDVWLSRARPGGWGDAPLATVAAPQSADRPHIAVAIDALGEPHVLVVHRNDTQDDDVLTHHFATGDVWSARTSVASGYGKLVTLLAAPASGRAVHVVLVFEAFVVWKVQGISEEEDLGGRVLAQVGADVAAAALAVGPDGAPWVALTLKGGGLHLWRPSL